MIVRKVARKVHNRWFIRGKMTKSRIIKKNTFQREPMIYEMLKLELREETILEQDMCLWSGLFCCND